MTEQIAIHCLKAIICEEVCEECELYGQTGTDHCEVDAVRIAISALEKQIPYKPQECEDKYYACKCGNALLMKWEKYPTKLMPKSRGLICCLACGQKLDWSE